MTAGRGEFPSWKVASVQEWPELHSVRLAVHMSSENSPCLGWGVPLMCTHYVKQWWALGAERWQGEGRPVPLSTGGTSPIFCCSLELIGTLGNLLHRQTLQRPVEQGV